MTGWVLLFAVGAGEVLLFAAGAGEVLLFAVGAGEVSCLAAPGSVPVAALGSATR